MKKLYKGWLESEIILLAAVLVKRIQSLYKISMFFNKTEFKILNLNFTFNLFLILISK